MIIESHPKVIAIKKIVEIRLKSVFNRTSCKVTRVAGKAYIIATIKLSYKIALISVYSGKASRILFHSSAPARVRLSISAMTYN